MLRPEVGPTRPRVLSAAWGRARRAREAMGPWIASKLPEMLLQCVLIIISILLALGVEEWRDARKDREMKLNSLDSFEREIRSNRRLLNDKLVDREGLRATLLQMDSAGLVRTPEEFYTLGVTEFQPVALKATAWQTAIATGVLRLLDYPIADALSETYEAQADHERSSERRLPDFLRSGTAPAGTSVREMVSSAARYLDDERQEERQLLATYSVALAKIDTAQRRLR